MHHGTIESPADDMPEVVGTIPETLGVGSNIVQMLDVESMGRRRAGKRAPRAMFSTTAGGEVEGCLDVLVSRPCYGTMHTAQVGQGSIGAFEGIFRGGFGGDGRVGYEGRGESKLGSGSQQADVGFCRHRDGDAGSKQRVQKCIGLFV